MQRVLIISGSYPPMRCGVGDYTGQLAQALAETGKVRVGVLTAVEVPVVGSNIEFIKGPGWKLRLAAKVVKAVANWKPDLVHVQYPTQGYGGSLLPWFLPLLLRLVGIPVVQTWHEFLPMRGHAYSFVLAVAGKNVVVVRPSYLETVGPWYRFLLRMTKVVHIPNASTIPVSRLTADQRRRVNIDISKGQERLVAYFGFAHPNKGVELIFQIANPDRDRILLICDLDRKNPYQRQLLEKSSAPPWVGKVTIAGFQSPEQVADLLAASDAVVLPFPEGGGDWNTSVHAVSTQGVLLITTSKSREGFDPQGNVFYCRPQDVRAMASALDTCAGRRVDPSSGNRDSWKRIAAAHLQLYRDTLNANQEVAT